MQTLVALAMLFGVLGCGTLRRHEPACVAAKAPALDIAYQTLAGVDPNLTSLDIYPPCVASTAAPVVVWVHGGAWAIGDKSQQIADKVAMFSAAGYVTVSVNYRLSPATEELAPDRIKHPTHERDVATAVAWVHQNIGRYGGDPTKLAMLGHSAGAHLVALLGTDGSYLGEHGLDLSALRCVGSFDTEAYDIPWTMQHATERQAVILRNAFGDDPVEWRAASPLHHVGPGTAAPPFLLVKRGDEQRHMLVESFHRRLIESGGTSTLIDATSLSHKEVTTMIGLANDDVMTPPVEAFLDDCFR